MNKLRFDISAYDTDLQGQYIYIIRLALKLCPAAVTLAPTLELQCGVRPVNKLSTRPGHTALMIKSLPYSNCITN
jgi:hypothetical protein